MGPLEQTREERPQLLGADRLLARLGAKDHCVAVKERRRALHVTPAQLGYEPAESFVNDSVVRGLRDAEMLARRHGTLRPRGMTLSRSIAVWLRKPVPALGDDKPLEVIGRGEYRRVAKLISGLEESPTT
jgi:hypothetical protein